MRDATPLAQVIALSVHITPRNDPFSESTKNKLTLSIIIPSYNEESPISLILDKVIRSYLPTIRVAPPYPCLFSKIKPIQSFFIILTYGTVYWHIIFKA